MPEGCCRPRITARDDEHGIVGLGVVEGAGRGTDTDVQSITRGASMRPRASCVARTWIALSVERTCASCPG